MPAHPGKEETAGGGTAQAWGAATEAARDRARARLGAVRHAEALAAAGMTYAQADCIAAAAAGASAKRVAAWRSQVRGLPEGGRVAALLDAPRSGRPSSIDSMPGARDALAALALHGGPHLTAAQARRVLLVRCGAAPSLSAVRRWLARWRRDNARAISAVVDPDRHRARRAPAGGDAAAGIVRLNQLWELDSTIADVICVDGRRRHVVAAVDVWSRRARVLVTSVSRAAAIAALLRRCILAWGAPEAVRTDEGRDYTAQHVLSALQDLEIAHRPCPPYTPEAKPFVERFLGTLARDLFAHLPGFSGHDVAQARALRARRSFAERHGSSADARRSYGVALDADALQARCDAWCEAVYARRPHAGLAGRTPFAAAAAWTGPRRRVADERALDALLAEPAGTGERTVGKKGVRVDGGLYIAPEIGALVGERVRVRRDPADLGRIHVYRADGRFVCIAEDPARTGLDRAETAARMKAAAQAADREARRWAAQLKRAQRPETAMDEVLAHAEAEAGRVVALPRPGAAHRTPALTQAAEAAEAAEAARAAGAAAKPARPRRVLAAARRLYLEEA